MIKISPNILRINVYSLYNTFCKIIKIKYYVNYKAFLENETMLRLNLK